MSHLSLIPAGSTIERVVWAVPEHYTSGAEFDTYAAALTYAIRQRESQLTRYREFHGASIADRTPHPERVDVDLRWTIRQSNGGSMDTAVERRTFNTLDEARRSLQFAVVGH